MNYQTKIEEFFKKMEIDYGKDLIDDLDIIKRIQHLDEEVDELKISLSDEEFIDALCDIVYLTIGIASMAGFDFDAHFNKVHTSNMKRIISSDREGYKIGIKKPEDWKEPDHKSIIESKK